MKLKSFCKAKDEDTVNWKNQQPTDWERIFFVSFTSNMEVISKMYKEFKKLDPEKTNNPIK